jgi:predicted GNAT family N-acyltransferase
MAVDSAWRRGGIGGRILEALEQAARERGMVEAVLHAQTYVQAFYASHGYIQEGDGFTEAGIQHVLMRKAL